MPVMVSCRMWSATVMWATSARPVICGSHKALLHSRPGTRTSGVRSTMLHLPFGMLLLVGGWLSVPLR